MFLLKTSWPYFLWNLEGRHWREIGQSYFSHWFFFPSSFPSSQNAPFSPWTSCLMTCECKIFSGHFSNILHRTRLRKLLVNASKHLSYFEKVLPSFDRQFLLRGIFLRRCTIPGRETLAAVDTKAWFHEFILSFTAEAFPVRSVPPWLLAWFITDIGCCLDINPVSAGSEQRKQLSISRSDPPQRLTASFFSPFFNLQLLLFYFCIRFISHRSIVFAALRSYRYPDDAIGSEDKYLTMH